MNVIFISNYFNHHQKPFCDEMCRILGSENFRFYETETISEWRKKLGYKEISAEYVDQYDKQFNSQIEHADVVIFGHVFPTFDSIIKKRIKQKKIVVKCSERIYKQKPSIIKLVYHRFKYSLLYGNSPYSYLLASSAYAPYDHSRLHAFKDNMLKWGYFPLTKHYMDVGTMISNKAPNSILWVSRFIDWKHPELAIQVAEHLKDERYAFTLNLIGTGELVEQYKQIVSEKGLSDCINILGAMPPEEVRTYMEKSRIFLFTSDRNEGWGAVLNESMNSACAVVANYQIGATPFLLNGNNGIVYHNFDELYNGVKNLLDDSERCNHLSLEAYKTITGEWSVSTAATRFVEFFSSKLAGTPITFQEGPCSKARIIKG